MSRVSIYFQASKSADDLARLLIKVSWEDGKDHIHVTASDEKISLLALLLAEGQPRGLCIHLDNLQRCDSYRWQRIGCILSRTAEEAAQLDRIFEIDNCSVTINDAFARDNTLFITPDELLTILNEYEEAMIIFDLDHISEALASLLGQLIFCSSEPATASKADEHDNS